MLYLIILIVILSIYILAFYNIVVNRKNNVEQANSVIDIYLQQRIDLIPNLVQCVKGYKYFEQNTLENIVKLRTNFLRNKNTKTGIILDKKIDNIILVAENYPELKASEQFINLQNQLVKIENQLQASRRLYDLEVEKYNSIIKIFPNNILAKVFGFKKQDFFEMEDD